ncbi:Retrovirus-related Pol polyprotein from type-1 retrotransposable element R2 [Araneus ventricosus]|uniref:Retrovirus-related Pol polyprotein from type-1 retrotransposable element R2 n=1 Tax=Araneus ventricosus TaxID=182803 RepID=A0A4Y2U8T0_ARAVE|nr:Retrovirus-related Pol polyprotein from type-1 retrotransposable element R2 [Araneus ventricosus]
MELCSISQCNGNNSSSCTNVNQLLELKLAECFEQLAVSPMDLMVRPRIHELTESNLEILRNLAVVESEVCLIANPVLQIGPPTDSKSVGPDSDNDNKSNKGIKDDKSSDPFCPDKNTTLESLESEKERGCPSVGVSKFDCHLCPFSAVKRSGLRLHLKKNHGIWKIPKHSNGLSENSSKCSVVVESAMDPNNVNMSAPSAFSEDVISDNSCFSSSKSTVKSPVVAFDDFYNAPEDKNKQAPSSNKIPTVIIELDKSPATFKPVKYFPDSLRCSFCEQVMSSPRSYFEHVREFLHYEKSAPASFEDFLTDNNPPHSGLVAKRETLVSPPAPDEGVENFPDDESPSDFLCLTCNNRFPSEAIFLQHECMSQSSLCETMVRCPKCTYFAASLDLMKIHLNTFHSPFFSDSEDEQVERKSPVPNEMNALLVYNPLSIRNQLLPPSPGPNRNCPVCGFVVRAIHDSKVEKILLRHVVSKHSCQNCKFVEKSNGQLADHVRLCRKQALGKSSSVVRNLVKSFDPVSSNITNMQVNTSDLSSGSITNRLPATPSHTCSGCNMKFTFAFMLDVHCARCDAFLRLTDDPSRFANRRVLYSCNSCSFIGKNEKELEIHLLNLHGIRLLGHEYSNGDPPSDSQAITNGRCSFNVDFTITPPASQDNVDPDDPPSHVDSQSNRASSNRVHSLLLKSIPTENCRIQDTLNIIFPFLGGLACPEPGCSKHFLTKSWYSTRGDLVRHLKRDHKLPISKTFYWCSVCKLHISKNPSTHPCIRQTGTLIRPTVPLSWSCSKCNDSFTTETGLRNHLNAHRNTEILQSGVQPSIVPPVKTRRRNRPPQVEVPEDTNETIADPAIQNQSEDFPDILTPPLTGEEIEEVRISEVSAPVHTASQKSRPRKIDPKDQKAIQPLFKKNRKRAVRVITGQEGDFCKIPSNVLHPYFEKVWSRSDYDGGVFVPTSEVRSPILELPFTVQEVAKKLKDAENTSAGPDRLTYFHWKSVEGAASFLCNVFNACIHFRKIPPSWKNSTTILLPKSGDPNLPANWRPIALSSTIYKLFTKCLAARLTNWIEKFDVLSPCQKGFTPFDGVIEHNYVLNRALENARKKRKDLCVAFLDISNAFGSLPHSAIFDGLTACGVGPAFVDIIMDIYTGSSTKVLSENGATERINILSGVKQGCPISGILFDICIDPAIREIQGSHSGHRILAFADDICLLAPSVIELQAMLDRINQLFESLNLKLNPAKCVSFHLSGTKPAGVRDSAFFINGTRLVSLKDGEFHKFLGKPIGFNPCPNYKSLNDLYQAAKAVMESGLSQWMRIDALKSFIYPAFQFPMRTSQFAKKHWHAIDRALRKSIKQTLSLPDRASNDYMYGHRKYGSFAIPILAEECELNRIDTAFKLLTSKDEEIKAISLEHLKATVRARMQKSSVSDEDLEAYMSATFSDNDNAFSNEFTCARIASARLKVHWQFDEGVPKLKHENISINASERKKVLFALRDHFRTGRSNRLLLCPKQGKAMECVAKSRASTHFLFNGDYTSFAVYRFFSSARLDLLSLRGNQPWKKNVDMSCRGCDECDLETLPHVLNHCKGRSRAWTLRHDCVCNRLVKALLPKGKIIARNQDVGPLGKRPDIVFQMGKEIFIIDVTIPFENRYASFESARKAKIDKY